MCFVSWRPYNKLFRPTSTKKQPFLLKKCQKWRFLSLKWCFLAPGGHLQPPLPYVEGAGLKNTRVLSIRSLLTSVSGPPTPKNSNFSSKKCKKWCFFALKWCFLALGGHLQPPLPCIEGAGLKIVCVSSIQSLVTRFSVPPAPKNSNFPSKKMQEMVFFALKWCFLALDGHLQPPLPYFEGAGLRKMHVFVNQKPRNKLFRPASTKKPPISPQKNTKNGVFLP